MVVLCEVEDAHAAIVGADIVESLNELDGVAEGFGQVAPGRVSCERFGEAAFVAQHLPLLAQRYHLAE